MYVCVISLFTCFCICMVTFVCMYVLLVRLFMYVLQTFIYVGYVYFSHFDDILEICSFSVNL